MPESVPAGHGGKDRPGRWVAETSWPSPRIANRVFHLAPGRLADTIASARLVIASSQTAGSASKSWLVAGLQDQREDNAQSLCFDSEPLVERIEILGAPEVSLVIASDRPAAFLVARLCDVAPDGSSTRVSYGALNLLTQKRTIASLGNGILTTMLPGTLPRDRPFLDACWCSPPRVTRVYAESSWRQLARQDSCW